MLNKNSELPLYVQLKHILREKIVKGIYKEGEMIPSETQLYNEYGITRTTIRKAIAELVNEGLLYKVHGKGTFVCFKQVKYNIWNFGGFTDYIQKRNETPVSKVLEKEIIDFEGQESLKLVRARGVKKENSIVYLTIDTSILDMERFQGIDKYDFSQESIYNIMRTEYGIYPNRAELGLHAVQSSEMMKELFNMDKDTPLLKAAGIVLDGNGEVIENVQVVYGPETEFKMVANMME